MDRPKPLYRRHDSKAECYRRATVPAMRTPHTAFVPVGEKGTNLPPPQEPEPYRPIPREE